MEPITVALPKGRLQGEVLALFAAAGYTLDEGAIEGRKLFFDDASGTLRFILAKPADVPVYVEYGASDMGIVGEDVLRENERHLYEPLGLGVGQCRLVLAGPDTARDWNLHQEPNLRIASKYPHLTLAYFQKHGISAEVIPLSGSVELAPAVGLADLLVDLVQTGRTLEENGLVQLETIMESQAMLVVNRASYNLKLEAIQEIIQRLEAAVQRRNSQEQSR